MGLTIHYSLTSKTKSEDRAREIVNACRQLAMDLPFEEVSEIIELSGDACDPERYRGEGQDSLRWLVIQSDTSATPPWNPRHSYRVHPTRIIAFDTWPGPGCEALNIGLCQYPSEIEVEYKIVDDKRFQTLRKSNGWESWQFDYAKFSRWKAREEKRTGVRPNLYMHSTEKRKIKVRAGGWSWNSFCKTQYASDPSCGGVANFLRCHVSAITLLERMAALRGLSVKIEDEGNYGPHTFSDDYREAYDAGRKPTYVWHPGQYNVAKLAEAVGEWNSFIAAFGGALKDAASPQGMHLETAIGKFQNFEQLEFKGCQNPDIKPFLEAMRTVGEKSAVSAPTGTDAS
jgi:hypothetical protein